MDNASSQLLEAWFGAQRGVPHDLILAGRIFGGRHGESMQCPRDYELRGTILRLCFDTTEVLTVEEPSGIRLGKQGELVIPRGTRATFGWHYYGRPQTLENWCEETYVLDGDAVVLTRTGPLLAGEERFALGGVNFVEVS